MASLIANYKLQSFWSLYYHSPTENNWGINSYTNIHSFNTIEDFWSLFHKISELQLSI